jgi:hypothetical protein
MPSTILFVGDCSIGGLSCLLAGIGDQIAQCPARDICEKFGCLRSIRFMVVCLDCVSSNEITTITDHARETLIPVLFI